MQIANHGPHSLIEDMRIDLCRGDIGVTQKLLYHPEIGPIL